MRKWKDNATSAENGVLNVQTEGLSKIFQKMGRQRTRINNTCSQILVTIKSTSGGILLIKKEDQVIEWSGLHYSFEKSVNMIELILLDSDFTDTVF